MKSIVIATTHFNPFNSKPAKDVYYEWLPKLGDLAGILEKFNFQKEDVRLNEDVKLKVF